MPITIAASAPVPDRVVSAADPGQVALLRCVLKDACFFFQSFPASTCHSARAGQGAECRVHAESINIFEQLMVRFDEDPAIALCGWMPLLERALPLAIIVRDAGKAATDYALAAAYRNLKEHVDRIQAANLTAIESFSRGQTGAPEFTNDGLVVISAARPPSAAPPSRLSVQQSG